MILAQGISIKEKEIEAIKYWSKSKKIRDIKIFIGFANFYCIFNKRFGKINMPLILMLKISFDIDVINEKNNKTGYNADTKSKKSKFSNFYKKFTQSKKS